MKKILNNIKQNAMHLWRDDSGAQMVEKVLIIAAISLPILAVLLYFSSEIREWVAGNWASVRGETASENNDPGDNPFGGDGGGGGGGGGGFGIPGL